MDCDAYNGDPLTYFDRLNVVADIRIFNGHLTAFDFKRLFTPCPEGATKLPLCSPFKNSLRKTTSFLNCWRPAPRKAAPACKLSSRCLKVRRPMRVSTILRPLAARKSKLPCKSPNCWRGPR